MDSQDSTTQLSNGSPTSRASSTLVLATYNTFVLTAHHVYHLVTPYSGAYYYNILNVGPAAIHIRADQDPSIGDDEAELLPAGHADNLILVPDGPAGLRVIADAVATVVLRLVRG